MKLYQLPNGKHIALDALVHLSEPQFNSGDYWAAVVCEATFALVEKPITLLLASYPDCAYGLGPKTRERNRERTLKRAQKEYAKLLKSWEETTRLTK